jgi:oligopeptide transport system substrate-binding protein
MALSQGTEPRKEIKIMNLVRNILFIILLLFSIPVFASQSLRRPLDVEPESLDPPKSSSDTADEVEGDLFEGLVRLDAHGKVIPAVAERWDQAADGITYTFHLRPNARWSNGDPLTAADFVFAWQRTVDPATGASGLEPLDMLRNARDLITGASKDFAALGVEAVDANTLRVVTSGPSPTFLEKCSLRYAFPLHRTTIEKWGKAWTQPDQMVSNGPFVLKSWTPQGSLVLARNTKYWDATSIGLDEVDYLLTEDEEVALKRFRAGELDFVSVPARDLSVVRRTDASELHTGQANEIHNFAFNMAAGPLAQNKALRLALALTFDPSIVVDKLQPRGQQVAYSWVPPRVPDHIAQTVSYAGMTMDARIDMARRLYAEAGYGPDHPLRLTVSYANFEDKRKEVLAAAQMWKAALGVETVLQGEEFQIYLQRVRDGDFQIALSGWSATFEDADSFLAHFVSDAPGNRFHYSNPALDKLLRAGASTIDPKHRQDLYQKAERLIADEVPGIPIYFNEINMLVNPHLKGWVDDDAHPHSSTLAIAD